MSNREPISKTSEWNFELLEKYDKAISHIANDFRLKTFPNQIEIITAEQMMDAFSNVGMPLGYSHWSFGKQFVNIEKNYKRGYMGLAYEIVINSNPCIAYLLEENTMTMQAMVLAHACYGHNSFFKNNYLFKTWTNPDSIIDYLVFSKQYIAQCEQKHGVEAVETFLDACHALMNYGVDRYKRPARLSLQEEKARQRAREDYLQSQVNELWRTIPNYRKNDSSNEQEQALSFPSEPQENLLYFIEKNAPLLESWQREIIRIVRKIAQYYYPQRQTKVMNEGWASYWHYTIINSLYDQGLVTDEFMLEFIQNHTNLVAQQSFDTQYFSGINPYTLGFGIYSDIKRICESPTDEDKQWFPELVTQHWLDAVHYAMEHFKDESFISQYLSPHLIRDLKLFTILDDDKNDYIEVSAIHDLDGYQHVRDILSSQYNIGDLEPNIQVFNVDVRGTRGLTLRYYQHQGKPLNDSANEVLKHFYYLWGFPITLEIVDNDDACLKTYHCPSQEPKKSESVKKEKD